MTLYSPGVRYADLRQRGFEMDKVKVELRYCYGIKKLDHTFDFSTTKHNAFALYAPNGVMKSSLAETFLDAAKVQASKDRVFPKHPTSRKISDEKGAEVEGKRVLVVVPYDEHLGPSAETSVLLVNADLRKELTTLLAPTNEAKNLLFGRIREQAKSKTDFELEIASAFTPDKNIFLALGRVRDEVKKQKDAPLAAIEYDKIFNEKVTAALGKKGLQDAVENYVRTYNELLAGSVFFRKGMFDYYNAAQIAESLAKNGFFDAKHTVYLKAAGKHLEINTQDELEAVITEEKDRILKDAKLRATFEGVATQLQKNAELREFCRYLQENDGLLAQMNNPAKLKEDILKSYLKNNEALFFDLLEKHDKALKREEEIADIAKEERTQWDNVIKMFNARFVVPFELEAVNKIACMLGNKITPELSFTYKGDGDERAKLDKSQLLKVLSNGERKALYILNVLFEVETRKKDKTETLVIVDDLADSFDYQNKYAIIHYLKEISASGLFKLIIMTHNFDFFRTIVSRFVQYGSGLMASKNREGHTLAQASGINNIFANDWKKEFFTSRRKKIASISFLRNLVEMTTGENADFNKLTSLLHWKADTSAITVGDLDAIYNRLCGGDGASPDADKLVHEIINSEANDCLKEAGGLKLENKVVLSIAARLAAERYMIAKIKDDAFVNSITKFQTAMLKEKFEEKLPGEIAAIEVLDCVVLMTPENIHLNSFMYEPLIDMSDEHLRRLYSDVISLG